MMCEMLSIQSRSFAADTSRFHRQQKCLIILIDPGREF